jgi:hypothetical protein
MGSWWRAGSGLWRCRFRWDCSGRMVGMLVSFFNKALDEHMR